MLLALLARLDARPAWIGGRGSVRPPRVGRGEGAEEKVGGEAGSFEAVYDAHVDFVWRSLRRLGVPDPSLEDAAQDVFVVVHRRLAEFEGRSSTKTWLFGIVLRVARGHRRSARRKAPEAPVTPLDERDARGELRAPGSARPDARAEESEALASLQAILDGMPEERREVFVLAELEGMTGPEIAEALGVNVNTVYARLRAARAAFEEAAARTRARDGWRTR